MPGNKNTFLNYSEDAMKAAVEEVRLHKISIRAAAKKFAVPRTTLKYKLEGKSPMDRKMGPPSILTSKEEAEISKWVENMAHAGFPVTVEQLCMSVEKYIKDVKRDTPFKDGRPGRTWVIGFLRRNPSISKRVSQNLTASRAAVTKANILNWFSEVKSYIGKEYGDEILEDPSRIFNCDESAFFLNPKGPKVLARKGDKTVYQKVNVDEKECVTVLVTGSASGEVAPTTCVYKYKRIPQDIAENFPKEWGLGKTDSGWMTCEAFFEFIADIFHPWLLQKQITFPVILFVDGHASHLCLQTSQFCEKNGIILVALLPNATHILQPMDVAVFRSLKEAWRKKIHQWRMDNVVQGGSHILKKKDFAKLLQEVILQNITKSMLSNGFKKCGLFPWNPQAVVIPDQGLSQEQERNSTMMKTQYLKQGLDFLNDMMGAEKVAIFEASEGTWNGDPLDTSLFKLWKKIKIEKLSSEAEESLNCVDGENISDGPVRNDDFPQATEASTRIADNLLAHLDSSEIHSDGRNIEEASVMDLDVITALDPNASDSVSVIEASSSLNKENVAGPSHKEIPSPFKRHFFYPAFEENKKKRIMRERMPTIVSGELCQKYFETKKKKKEDLEQLKIERATERQRKKEENERLKKNRVKVVKNKHIKSVSKILSDSSDSSVDVSSGDSVVSESSGDENLSNLNPSRKPLLKQINEYVIFTYDNKYYPGKIINVTEYTATISSMIQCGRLWKWPERPDVLEYQWKNVTSHINEPKKTSKTRNVYSVPELDFMWD